MKRLGLVAGALGCFCVGVWWAAGCSSGSPVTDDGGGDGLAGDATPDAGPPCDLTKPFGTPVPIAELSTPSNDDAPRLTHDELTVYFHRWDSADAAVPDGSGTADLYVASRPSLSAPFGPATPLTGVNSPTDQDIDPSPTGDNLELFFASNRGDAGRYDLWVATRSSTSASFGNVTTLTSINTPLDDQRPYVMPDGLTLYFDSLTASSTDLFLATRPSTSAPFALDTSSTFLSVDSAKAESSAVVMLDELTLYFASNRAGTGVKGGFDIWMATRTSTAGIFENAAVVSELNSSANDTPSWISDDGCRLYLESDRAGSFDIYVAAKPAN